jgi:aromatase
MAQLRIRTARHTIRVAAPAPRIYQLIADVDHWPRMFDSVDAVDHIGWDGTGQRVRFWGTFGDRPGTWVSSRELNPKRLQLRYRQEQSVEPFASLGGLWLVIPKGAGAVVALDHYYTVVGDDSAAARHADDMIDRRSVGLLDAVRRTAESGELLLPTRGGAEGVSSR